MNLDYSDLKKLKVFFFALKKSGYKPKQISASIVMDGALTPIDKTRCLELLRSFPGLEGKDDNQIFEVLSNPNKVKSILGQLTYSQQNELTEVLTEKPVAAEGVSKEPPSGQEGSEQQAVPASTTAGSSARGMFPGMPSGSSISPGPRRIYRIPHAPEPPKPEIHIANVSGYVTEQGDASKLVRATTKGTIKEAGEPSKLVTTSGGAVKETPPSKIFIADKGGVREHAIKPSTGFKFPSVFSNFGKNITSKMGVFIKRNLTPMRIGTVVSGGIGGIAGAGFGPLGVAVGGGLGALAPSWIRSGGATRFLGRVGNGAINAGARLSNSASRLSIPGPGKKFLIFGLLGLLILILAVLAIISAPSQTTIPPPGGVTTPAVDLSNCKFTRSGNSLPIKSSSLMSWINNTSAQSGVPAAILASVAMHESANFVANADDNHDAIKSNNYCQEGSTFCEKSGQFSHDGACTGEEIAQGARTAKAVGLMQIIDIYNPGKNLCSLTESLSIAAEKLKANGITTQSTKDQVTTAINRYYNSCTYGNFSYCEETWQDLQNCQASSAPATNIISCPVTGGRVTNGSKDTGGHCSPSYVQQYGSQGCTVGEAGYTGRDKAVDIVGTFSSVYLPVINGKEVTWNVAEASKTISDAEGGGEDFVATAIAEGKHYRIRFVHLESIPPDLKLGSQAQSNKLIGSYYQSNPYGAHIHITIQENGEFKPADTYFNLCK